MAVLEVIGGTNAGTQYRLDRERARIGRHPNCDILLDWVAAVSRYHAEVSMRDDRFFIHDLESRNGTFVNGERVRSPQRLYHLDRVQICDLEFLFHDDRPQSQPPESTSGSQTIAITLLDDRDTAAAEIMSRIDVSSGTRRIDLKASANTKLHAMMELSDSLVKALSVDDVMVPVLDSLFKIFPLADHGVIALLNEDKSWEPRCVRFRRPTHQQAHVSRSIIDHVIEKQEAVLSANTPSDERFDASESIVSLKINSCMCVPLIDADGGLIGAMQVDATKNSERFQDEDLELAVAVASQAANSIQRAILHDKEIELRSVQAELDLARRVQLGLLPENKPELEGYEFFDFYRAANQIGGDLYNYVTLPDGRVASLVADVSGHGIAAAMVMAKLAADVQSCLTTISCPGEAVAELNNRLCSHLVDGAFVTMALLLLDPAKHQLSIVNAGHPHPLWRRSDGTTEPLTDDGGGPLLGVIEDATYTAVVKPLQAGEMIAIYTDGITEAIGEGNEQYGESRLIEQLSKPLGDVATLGKQSIDHVESFTGGQPQSDDICLVCLRRK